MAKTLSGQGGCLCGAVRFKTDQANAHVDACHCSMCRRWGGGPYFAVECGTQVRFEGEENISLYDSSEWAERAFCKRCGTHLFYRLKQDGQYALPAGLFDGDPGFDFTLQIFVDEKPGYYDFANDTRKMTGAEVIAQFASPDS